MRSLETVLLVATLAASMAACNGGDGGPTAIELPIARLEFVERCSFVVTDSRCTLVVEAFTAEGQRIANPILRWSSSNSGSVSIVDQNGAAATVRGVAPGSSTVTVSNTTTTTFLRTDVRVLPRSDTPK
ncbi:MAG: hypothetical protein KY397_03210 [Gemmatimonadetes bacterium]|nr:hypothetical protein [Gemmatimonadota bacterium]